ncbi:MAG TPA: hypothetical protein VES88_00545 [Gemmatimonadaceae bacterium]|nr:hypothetical protein [Gemmatimonadaceae bacterium]
MNTVARSVLRSALAGAAIGLVVLGIGGRVIMRVIAHWEGRAPAFTTSGTFTVVMMGALAGLAAGVAHGLLRRFVTQTAIRLLVFVVLCVAFTYHAVNALLPRPRLLFVALTLAYVAVLEVITSKAQA